MAPLCRLVTALALLALGSWTPRADGGVTTSVDKIKNMVLQETFILDNLRAGLKRHDAFREFYHEKTTEIKKKNFTELQATLNHPNTLYKAVLEYSSTYAKIRDLVKNKVKKSSHEYLFKQLGHFADNYDIVDARLSLIRLQSVYGLSARDMAAGNYSGVSGPALDGPEAFIIGWTAFQDQRFRQACDWLEVALDAVKPKPKEPKQDGFMSIDQLGQETSMNELLYLDNGVSEVTIKALYGRALLRAGKINGAKMILTELQSRKGGMEDPEAEVLQEELHDPRRPQFKDRGYTDNDNKYFTLCAMDATYVPNRQSAELICRYKSIFLPYFRVGEEVLSVTPYVSIFYDIINDPEANLIKGMVRAKLFQGAQGAKPDDRRTSQLSFLRDTDAPMVNWLSQRIGRLVGLHMPENSKMSRDQVSCAEALQVVNYGLGGHYTIHIDPIIYDTKETEHVVVGSGDRMASFMLHLSNVEKGGATVFPSLDISVKPVKRSALFWYNFTPRGQVDYGAANAACPVIVGDKWVANKWILNHCNAFKRRCGLKDASTQLDVQPWMDRDWRNTPEMALRLLQARDRIPMTKAQRRAHFLNRARAKLARLG